MMKKAACIWLSVITLTLLFFACNESDSDNQTSESITETFDLEGQIAYVFDYGIQPQIKTFKDQAKNFKLLVTNYNNTPNEENFEALRDSWQQLILAWKPLEAITIGDFALTSKVATMHFWPFDVALLETNIESYTEASFEIGSTAKGLGALEYILFSNDYETFREAENHAKAAAYIDVLTDDVILTIDSYEAAWLEYEEEFKTSTETGVTGTQNQLLNKIVFTFFDIIVDKIQGPIVANIEGADFPASETPYSEFSLAIIEAQILFVERFFSGKLNDEEVSFSVYDQLVFVGREDLVEVLQNQFNVIRVNLSSKTETLESLVISDSEDLNQIEENIRILHTLISNDVFSALSITTTVSDNDGDS